MGRHPTFIDWKTQNCLDGIWVQIDLQIVIIPIKNPSKDFCRIWQANPKIQTPKQKIRIATTILYKEKQSWRTYISQFQNLLKSYSKQSVILA